MTKISKFVFFFFSIFLFSQSSKIEFYPKYYDFYKGGEKALYSEMHNILKKENIDACDEDSFVNQKLIIDKNGYVKLVKDLLEPSQNACAKESLKKVLPFLKNWKPFVDKNNVAEDRLVYLKFAPYELKEKYKEGFLMGDIYTDLEFEEDGKVFWRGFKNCIDLESYNIGESMTFDIYFSVNEKGNPDNVYLDADFYNPSFELMIVNCIKNQKLIPATINRKPIKSYAKVTFRINVKGVSMVTSIL